ncbi:membrane protein YpdK [Escherichia coli]|nr:membrane protein YpdK [Escherichia coli]
MKYFFMGISFMVIVWASTFALMILKSKLCNEKQEPSGSCLHF